MDFAKYKIHIVNNKIDIIEIWDDKKYKEYRSIEIKDSKLQYRISKIKYWLKVYPLNNYIMNEQEYLDYKDFMEQEKYKNDCPNISSLQERARNYVKNNLK